MDSDRQTMIEALEVTHTWEGNVLASLLLTEATSVTVGDVDATLLLPAEVLGERVELAHAASGRWVTRLEHAAMRVWKDGELLEQVGELALERGMVVELRVARFTFTLRVTERPIAIPRQGFRVDASTTRFVGGAFAVAALFIGMFMLVPPAASAMTSNLDARRAEYIRAQLDAAARELPIPAPAPTTSENGGGEASPEAGDGEPGQGDGGARPVRRGASGGRRGEQPALTADDVRSLGTLSTWRTLTAGLGDGDGSPFGSDDDVGMSWRALEGVPGSGGLFGGLDMNDHGRGTCTGERCGDGVARVASLMDRPGDVPGAGELPEDRRVSRVPHGFRPGVVETRGGLAREQIRRIVSRHRNEVSYCYEQALVGRPELEGRVTVRFFITPSGAVQTAVADDPMSGGRVGQCVSDAVRRWAFPASEGLTSVSYPFVFQSGT